MEKFEQTYSYKLIYVFSMPYETHKGMLKVGEATLKTDIMPNELVPNCRTLNQAAKARIDSYTKTASMSYKLEYTELALKTEFGYSFTFKDKDVHKVLMNSGVHKVQPNGATGEEWFATDIETVKAAIKSVKNGKSTLSSSDFVRETRQETIDFREEQIDAIEKTLKTFKKDDEMLWYAKMRFGKTLSALEVIRRSQYRRVIIATHRPVVDDGWSEDFKKIFFPGNSEHEYHYERKTKDSAYTFDEKTDAENDLKIRKLDKDGTYFVYFASVQDLRGSKIVGGKFNKNNAVFALDWDLIIIDEAHEGTQTELGDNVVKALKKDHTKVLALSGTPFNLLDKFGEDNVYTWDYVMEQKKKTEWDLTHQGDHNPYADLPKMHIFTYDLGEKLKKYVSDEYDTKAFNFREFFRVWYKGPNGNRELPKNAVEGKFVHENDVNAFLNLMVREDTDSGYPYSTQEYRDMFRHTLWMVPGVKEAQALSELLRNHPVFKHFGIANVAGEGDRYEEEHSGDALELVRDTIKNYDHSITLSCGNELKDIIGASKASKKKKDVVVNGQGLTDEQVEHIDDPEPPTPPKDLTKEEQEERKKKKQAKEARKKAIDILRGVSIRMPLMIYGADVPIEEDIDINSFVDIIDDESWKEFMPTGVSKKIFTEFTKYYDRDVFIAAGKRIRRLAAAADRETPTRRVIQIAEIFRHFKNPDKETVLTPWRVVNMHMSETLGGWCFYNDKFEEDTQEKKHRLEAPRFVDHGEVTEAVFAKNSKILEINSKTGLYPLYVAYSFYKQRMDGMSDDDWTPEECQYFWNEVIRDNVYVICKTPMAKSITRRTLCGYSDVKCNAHYFDDLVNMLKNKPEQFKKRVMKGSYWKKDVKEMKFDAVVGNPPYQEETDATRKPPIYNYFYDMAFELAPIATLVTPARFLFDAGQTSKEWNRKMLSDEHFKVIRYFENSKDVFDTVDIKGGVAITYHDSNTNFGAIDIFTAYSELNEIISKVKHMCEPTMDTIISARGTYRTTNIFNADYPDAIERLGKGTGNMLVSNFFEKVPEAIANETNEPCLRILCRVSGKRSICNILKKYIQPNKFIDKYNVASPEANSNGRFGERLTVGELLSPEEGATDTFISLGAFDTKFEALALQKYMKTKFFRALLGVKKVTQHCPPMVWEMIPCQEFSENSDIDWSKSIHEIDLLLYKKYGLSDEEIAFIESKVKPMDGTSYYESMLKTNYQDIVSALLKKYGSAKHNYFKDTACKIKNSLVTRTNEGLFCHHIDEDKAIMLCNDKFAVNNPFEYQKADRLVYCNLLEHLLLHVKIAENPSPDANENELPGIGGAINFICKDLNDIYSGKEFSDEWRKNVADKVKDNFDDYIIILRYLWNIVEKNPVYKAIITKEMLCVGWDGKVAKEVMKALNANE